MNETQADWRRHHDQVEALVALGSWLWDLELDLHWWSANLHRLLASPLEREPSLDAFLDGVHPDDRRHVRAHFDAAARNLHPSPVGCRLLANGGKPRHLRVASVVSRTDESPRVLAVVQDVTESHARERELLRAKELLEQAQAMAQVGSWVWDPAADHVEISPAMRTIFGVDSELDPTIDCLLGLVHPDDALSFSQALERVRRDRQPASVEIRIRRKDGSERDLAMMARPLDTEGGARLAGVVLDVTERRRLEARLRWSETLRALSRLSAGIAHEFNNLLTVVVGHAQVLYDKEPSDDLEAILQAAKNGAELTRRLLAFARESPAEVRPLVLEDEVADGARILSRLVGSGLRIELALSSTPTTVLLDPAHLHRALLGLAENARDAMPRGGTLRISTTPKTVGDRAGVELVLADEGVGMDEATRQRATEPFFTTKGPGEGDGMGLAVVYGLVEQMGGTFELRSEPGAGTEAVIWLPATVVDTAESDRPAGAPKATHPVVLVVEDDPLVRRLVRRILVREGYEVVLAEGPDEAIALAQQRRIDALLTDLTMPGGGGRRVAADLRAQHPDLPVLYMTGFSPNVGDLDAPVLFKPFQPDKLLRALERLLG